jgi:TonB-linked SusC/RagA family outer membrane protein
MKQFTRYFISGILLLFSASLAGSAVRAQSIGSQFYVNSQNVGNQKKSLALEKGMDLKLALKIISRQFGVAFVYRDDVMKGKKVIRSINLPDNLQTALQKLLKGGELRFEKVNDKTYGIFLKKEPQPAKNEVVRQETVSGTVTDAQTGDPLAGVNILVVGTSSGAATDSKGHYNVNVPSLQDTLRFSFIGFQTKTVPIDGQNAINVALKPTIYSGQQMVVVGFGEQKKADVTGAISSVHAKNLANTPVHRIEQTLEGRVSGVRVTRSSGAPGASSTVRIRGTTSINNSQPLYVVDGMPVDNGGINYLNPNDIKSIQVLKDAASAAIYGTRGASGVILVTTKHGNQGNLQIHYNGYVGFQQPAKKLNLLNATQYATLINEASVEAGNGRVFANPQSLGQGTDWQDLIFNNQARETNQYLSFSGGNDHMTYLASLGYYDQQGIVSTPISHVRKYMIRLNTTFHPRNWIKFGENLGYTYLNTRGIGNTNSEFGGQLSSAINLDPITPVVITNPKVANGSPYSTQPVIRNAKGQPYGISPYVQQEMANPLAYTQTHLGNFGYSHNIVGNLFADIIPYKGLEIRTSLGLKPAFYGSESFTPIYYLNAATTNLSNNSFYRQNEQGFILNWNNTIQYTWDYHNSHFKFLVGNSVRSNNAGGVSATYQGIPASSFNQASFNFSVPTKQRIAGGYENQPYGLNSYFGRINYNYKNKYLLTALVRTDASTRFGSDNRYGTFPAVSAGWVPTLEKFWPDNNVLTFLKIRGSYGVNGNDKSLDPFQYESTIGGGRNYIFGTDGTISTGASPNAPANPDLRWEKTSQIDLGFDATLYHDFRVTFDVYRKKTSGMLLQVHIPAYVGANGNPYENVSSLKNRGVELSLNYQKQIGSFNINLNGNASYNQNTITDIGANDFLAGNSVQAMSYNISRTAVGHPINSFYGFKILGIFQTQKEVNNYAYTDPKAGKTSLIQPNAKPGDFKWADLNHNGAIGQNDRTFLGNPTPPWTFGLSASVAWRNADLRVFGQGVYGNQIYDALRRHDISYSNYTTRALNRWTGPGTSNTFPRLDMADPNKNFTLPSAFYLSPGSYFRIKSLQIGYTLPVGVLNAIGIQNLRVYLEGQNLATFTKYAGFDPEIGGGSYSIDRGVYPQARAYIVGLDITI